MKFFFFLICHESTKIALFIYFFSIQTWNLHYSFPLFSNYIELVIQLDLEIPWTIIYRDRFDSLSFANCVLVRNSATALTTVLCGYRLKSGKTHFRLHFVIILKKKNIGIATYGVWISLKVTKYEVAEIFTSFIICYWILVPIRFHVRVINIQGKIVHLYSRRILIPDLFFRLDFPCTDWHVKMSVAMAVNRESVNRVICGFHDQMVL